MQCEVAAALGLRERRRWHSADDLIDRLPILPCHRSFKYATYHPPTLLFTSARSHIHLEISPRQLGAPHSTRKKMRQADDDDEGIEMGGTLDPEDGLQGIASKARPMPKW